MKALSVLQPWAWLIVHAGKDIENRSWKLPEQIKGLRIAVHASTRYAYRNWSEAIMQTRLHKIEGPMELYTGGLPARDEVEFGVIVGTVEISDCVTAHPSPWFQGPYGFVLRNPVPLRAPIPCRGALGFWTVPKELEALLV